MPQVCYSEVWFIGCPSSLGLPSSATTYTLLPVSSLSCSSIPFARTCVRITPFPGRMGAPPFQAHMPPLWKVCVCVQPLESQGSFRIVLFWFCFGFYSRGCQGCTLDWHQRRRQCCICEINPGRRIDVPALR